MAQERGQWWTFKVVTSFLGEGTVGAVVAFNSGHQLPMREGTVVDFKSGQQKYEKSVGLFVIVL